MQKQLCMKSACDMLLRYGRLDAKAELKQFGKSSTGAKLKTCKKLLQQLAGRQDLVFWPTGLLAAGLWKRFISSQNNDAANSGKREIELALNAYFDRWQRKGFPIACMDDLLSGEVFLDIYLTGASKKEEADKNSTLFTAARMNAYKEAIDKLAAYALSHPIDRNGCFPYRSNRQKKNILVDSVGLSCPFLYQYGISFGQFECTELALRQIEYFLLCGMDHGTGLPYHGYEAESGAKYGIIGWGRGVGWLLRGMYHCMIDDHGMERLGGSFRALMDNILLYQRKDGFFSWQLQAVEGPADSSATGLICVALQEGIRIGSLKDEKYHQALTLGTEAICRAIKDGLVYQCSGECQGLGCYPQIYDSYPWSLAPALLLDVIEAV